MSTSASLASADAAPWLDEGEPNPEWPAPTRPEGRSRRRLPGWLFYGVLGLAVVVLVSAVWGFGGLRRRTDLFTQTAPGTLISTGPYELTFTEATAQRSVDSDTHKVSWEIEAIGTGRTTGDVSLAPDVYDNGMFVTKDPTSAEVQESSGFTMGEDGKTDRRTFTPGAPPIRYVVSFDYSSFYTPGPVIRLVVFTQKYSDTSLVGDGEKTWHNGLYAFELNLPVRVLPDAT